MMNNFTSALLFDPFDASIYSQYSLLIFSLIQCQWHRRENVTSYLHKGKQDEIKKALQNAYDLPTYKETKAALDALKPELALMNESAQNSLEEGLDPLKNRFIR